ncbi:CopL family metal-binding regulatory protein [Cognatilysobacter bugurensis]|uniref:CopL family metal-binding regulatory protein n=1 Tax=Cognatilysobacter bugurensis TaxID=543356 RepID=A0A918W896_9GAMM|nr:CopL family metal-binding regulatory protein [Lysobacter bugurensis]GHA80137.1 hypothetical protein GCM10007067_17260 [Lysobacter bugurensis]
MNPVRRLLNLLLCLLLALNGAAVAHAGAASGAGHGAHAGVAMEPEVSDAMHSDDAPPCHDGSDAAADVIPTALAVVSDVSGAPCCDDSAAVCDQACMAASAALASDRAMPADDRLRSDVPTLALHARAPPRVPPPIRPPIV